MAGVLGTRTCKPPRRAPRTGADSRFRGRPTRARRGARHKGTADQRPAAAPVLPCVGVEQGPRLVPSAKHTRTEGTLQGNSQWTRLLALPQTAVCTKRGLTPSPDPQRRAATGWPAGSGACLTEVNTVPASGVPRSRTGDPEPGELKGARPGPLRAARRPGPRQEGTGSQATRGLCFCLCFSLMPSRAGPRGRRPGEHHLFPQLLFQRAGQKGHSCSGQCLSCRTLTISTRKLKAW